MQIYKNNFVYYNTSQSDWRKTVRRITSIIFHQKEQKLLLKGFFEDLLSKVSLRKNK